MWISRFAAIMSQYRGSPWYQVKSKIAGTEILLISETWLVLILPPEVFYKKGVIRNFVILAGKHLCQSLFLSCNFISKETLAHEFSLEFCKIFKNTCFTESLRMVASILQQLLALYFANIYSWQRISSDTSLVGKKIHLHISRILLI